MKNFCKISEYQGELPNPKLFPITKGGSIIGFRNCPNTFSDGFILDMSVTDENKKILDTKVTLWRDNSVINNVFEQAKNATVILPEPEEIYESYSRPVYVFRSPSIIALGIQARYFNYFRNRYPGCSFWGNDKLTTVNVVKVDDRIVGFWMSMVFPGVLGEIQKSNKGG